MTADRERKTAHLVINPQSGYGVSRTALAELRVHARKAGVRLIEYVTRAAHDATAYVARIADQAEAVVVWGGDGTAREVAEGLAGSPVPMLPCPIGTENLMAKEVGIPPSPREIVNIIRTGPVVPCDIGTVNGRNFLMITGVGFDGEVVSRLSAQRTGHISHFSYFWPIWRTFWEHDFPRMRIIADGEEVFDDFALAFVGNISRYAVGLRICRDAVFDDGLLDLVVFTCREQTALMMHAAWTLLRLHPLEGGVIYRRVRRVRIETESPAATQIDGDVGPETPLDIAIRPGALKLIVSPPQPAWKHWPWKAEETP